MGKYTMGFTHGYGCGAPPGLGIGCEFLVFFGV